MRRVAPIVLVAVLTAACAPGSGDGTGAEGGPASETSEPTIQIAGQTANDHGRADVAGRGEADLELGDVFFSPTVLVGEPGQTLAVSLENAGDADHTFTVAEQDVDVTLRPGESDAAEVTFPESGALLFVCRFHEGAGMRGGLSVGGNLGGTDNGGTDDGGTGGYGGGYG